MADNSIMDETFDFSAMSLEEPGDRMAGMFDQSLQLQDPQSSIPSLTFPNKSLQPQQVSIESPMPSTTCNANPDTAATTMTDNGPWAKIPEPNNNTNPFQPGVTAQRLDAMAADPNHVFKSAQTPAPFPFTVPSSPPVAPTSPPATTKSSHLSSIKGNDIQDKQQHQFNQNKNKGDEQIPAWMLEEPELVPNWVSTSATATTELARELDQDWSTLPDRSTTVDAASLFGFTSFPSYESLPIANSIAEEHNRRQLLEYQKEQEDQYNTTDDHQSAASSSLFGATGGFARYGDQGPFQFGATQPSSIPMAEALSHQSQQQHQWRQVPNSSSIMDVDDDEDDVLSRDLDTSPVIK
ncbi:hypothetical protein BGZ83_012117 [Gryganskiella cystojenkinii]|nr:hypothetical protein BGZ83_012117 [Gryganskiella cystojenkinii]